jgi:hypothetical protein
VWAGIPACLFTYRRQEVILVGTTMSFYNIIMFLKIIDGGFGLIHLQKGMEVISSVYKTYFSQLI